MKEMLTKNIVDCPDMERTMTSAERVRKIFQTITIDDHTQNLNDFFSTNIEKIVNSNDEEFLKKIFVKKENEDNRDIRKEVTKFDKSIDIITDVEADNTCNRFNRNLDIKNVREEER